MSQSVDSGTCRFVDERLDAYFDGELGELERARVGRHLAHCPACANTVAAFDDLRLSLRQAHPREACPPAVTAAVLELAGREAARSASRAPNIGLGARLVAALTALLPSPVWRPVLVGSAAALLLAVPLWRTLAPGRGLDSAAAERAELAQAEQEARLVLAYVASIGESTGTKVRQEIMNHRIVEPTRRAFGFTAGEPAATER